MERYFYALFDITPQLEAGLNALASYTPYLLPAAAVVAVMAVAGLVLSYLLDQEPSLKQHPLIRQKALERPVSFNRQALPQLQYKEGYLLHPYISPN